MIENAIADFAHRMDMPTFALNENGLATLELDDSSFFTFEFTRSELLLYLVFPANPHDNEAPAKALELAHYKYNHPIPIFTGLYRDHYMLLTRFEEKDVTAAQIETAFQYLMSLRPQLER